MEFEPVIGLEVHAQLKTRTKIFCGCSTAFGAPPNTHTCPVCLGMPGVLPVLKPEGGGIRPAHGPGDRLHHRPRKPLCPQELLLPGPAQGLPDLPVRTAHRRARAPRHRRWTAQRRRIGITRIHMEEDAGKLIHDPERPVSLVDFNRTGVPLIEIVSEPDLRTPEEAGAYLRQLRAIVRYLDICDGNLEEGSFRCDANVSIRPRGARGLRHPHRTQKPQLLPQRGKGAPIRDPAAEATCWRTAGRCVQETRLWDPAASGPLSMRGKEEAHDYRYFPDPDLLPLSIDDAWIAGGAKRRCPNCPTQKKERFVSRHRPAALRCRQS